MNETMTDADCLRFTDILTMASSVASYVGAPDVSPGHMLAAIDILRHRRSLEDFGRPRSPLTPLPPSLHGGAEPAIRALVQRWFEDLDKDPEAELDKAQLEILCAELEALTEDSDSPK